MVFLVFCVKVVIYISLKINSKHKQIYIRINDFPFHQIHQVVIDCSSISGKETKFQKEKFSKEKTFQKKKITKEKFSKRKIFQRKNIPKQKIFQKLKKNPENWRYRKIKESKKLKEKSPKKFNSFNLQMFH